MKRLIVLLVMLAVLAGLTASAEGSPTRAPSKVSLYFLASRGRTLLRVQWSLSPPTPAAAAGAVLRGPTHSERARGAEAVVPKPVRLLRIRTRSDVATLALRGSYLIRLSTILRLRVIASLTYTLTGLPKIRRARFTVDARPWGIWSLQGTIIRDYQRRSLRRSTPACAPGHGCFAP
jgi:spore germination protein GerM